MHISLHTQSRRCPASSHYPHADTRARTHTHTHIHARTHARTRIHAHTHTYTHTAQVLSRPFQTAYKLKEAFKRQKEKEQEEEAALKLALRQKQRLQRLPRCMGVLVCLYMCVHGCVYLCVCACLYACACATKDYIALPPQSKHWLFLIFLYFACLSQLWSRCES